MKIYRRKHAAGPDRPPHNLRLLPSEQAKTRALRSWPLEHLLEVAHGLSQQNANRYNAVFVVYKDAENAVYIRPVDADAPDFSEVVEHVHPEVAATPVPPETPGDPE